MTVKVLNPDSAILNQIAGQWEKLFVLMLYKLQKHERVRLTHAEIAAFPKDVALLTHGHFDSIDFQIVSMEKAHELAEYDERTNKGTA